VTTPEKVGEGVGSYTTYKVCARVDLSVMKEFKRDRAEVRRRYRDFEWLHTVLKEEHPSSVIPPLPSKAFINKFAPQFIEQRRKHLYKFLHRVAGHPVLARTEEFRMFLMGSLDDYQQDMFENYRIGMTPAPSIGETIYRVFKGAAKSIVNYTKSASAQNPQPAGGVMGDGDSFIVAQNPLGSAAVVNSGSGAGAPVPGGGTGTSSAALALGQDFVAVAKYAADLEANLYAVAEAASAVGFRRAAYARSMQELGRAFETLGRAEYTAELSHVLVEVGKATETFGDMELRGCEKEDSQLVEPLREYIGMARALREMVANGEEAYTTFASVRSELELLAGRRRHAAQDLRRHGTLEGLDGEIEAMRLTREKAHAALAASLKSIEGEVRHFNREKLAEFRLLLQGFLTLNSEQHKRIHTGWVSLTPTLEGILSPPKETALNFNLPPLE
jgi:sorting nexin-1/2